MAFHSDFGSDYLLFPRSMLADRFTLDHQSSAINDELTGCESICSELHHPGTAKFNTIRTMLHVKNRHGRLMHKLLITS